jgi:hypothetical protein
MNRIEFTPQQQTVIEEIYSGNSIADAIAATNVLPGDFHAWRRNIPFFAEVLEQALSDRDFMHREKAASLVDLAYQALGDILRDDKASPSIKFKAAKFIVEQARAPLPSERKNADVPALPPLPNLEIPPNCTKMPNGAEPPKSQTLLCPCGSGKKFLDCCFGKPRRGAA